jgi:hypothetical protein
MKYSRLLRVQIPQEKEIDPQKEQTKQQNPTPQPGLRINPTVLDIVKMKSFKQEKYLELVKKWLEMNYEYDYLHIESLEDLRDNYAIFLKENINLNEHFITFSLNIADIPKLDNRYILKRCYVCKSCKTRHFKKCCEEYDSKNRVAKSFIVNLRRIN